MIEHILQAQIPRSMGLQVAERIVAKGVAFDNNGLLMWPGCAPSTRSVRRVWHLQTLTQQILPRHGTFLVILEKLLQIRPSERLIAKAALQCSFVVSRGAT